MLQEFREQHLTWDKANRRIHESAKANASDSHGRKLTVQVLNDGVVEDLTGTSLSLYWETRSKQNKGLDAFDVVDASQGTFELYYTTGMLSNEGELRANLVLVDDLGKIVSDAFVIEVSPGIDEGAVESSDSFTALTKALVDIQNLEQNYAPQLQEVTAQLAQTNAVLGDTTDLYEPPIASDEWIPTDGYSGKTLDMSDAEFLDRFYNKYLGSNSNGMTVTRNSKGVDESGLYTLYEYVFTPENPKETILLSSGMHPYELSAHFGLSHFVEHLMTNTDDSPVFKYLSENVEVKIIPIINPWGWNQSPMKYGNVNGVNINRNFDHGGAWDGFPVHSPNPEEADYNEWNVKGTAPFSEKETQILRDWVLENDHASFWIDCHTGLNIPEAENFIYYLSDTPLYSRIWEGLLKLEGRIRERYNVEPRRNIVVDSDGSIRHRFSQYTAGVPTMTLEQTPRNTVWGTVLNNEGIDITEYEVTLVAYIGAFLGVDMSASNIVRKNKRKFYEVERVLSEVDKKTIALNKRFEEWYLMEISSAPVIVKDDFNRANSTDMGSAQTGQEWYGLPGDHSFGIDNNKARLLSTNPSSNQRVFVDVGESDYVTSVDITFGSYAGIQIKSPDSANYTLLRLNNTGLLLAVAIQSNSTTIGNVPFNPEVGRTYHIDLYSKGKFLKVFLDGKLVIEGESPSVTTNTNAGLRVTSDTQSTFDNFVVKSL